MSQTSSLADCAVDAISAVRSIGETIDNEHPMRHAVRNIKRTAEQILSDAFRQARDLAYQSERLVKDYEEDKKGGHS